MCPIKILIEFDVSQSLTYFRMESVRAAFRGSGNDDESLLDGVGLAMQYYCSCDITL